MKILLLNPYYLPQFVRSARWSARSKGRSERHPDYLAIATAVLEEAGHICKLLDAQVLGLREKAIEEIISDFRPDMTVIHTTTPSIYNDVKYAELAKKYGSITVLVGTHVSALPYETVGLSGKIDSVIVGEYDLALRDLANGLISFKHGRVIKYPPIKDLDELPFPSWKHIDPKDYFDAGKLYPFITLISGRGCPHRCTFCILPQIMYGKKYRFRSPEKVVDEMEYDLELFPYLKEIMFEDDTLTANRKRLKEICSLILERDLDISWSCNVRADLTDLSLMKLMKKAGCRMMVVGFEFGCQESLDAVKKGLTISIMKKFSKVTKEAGIKIHGCFMIGAPNETRETAEATIKLSKELNCDTLQFSALVPYPATEFYDWCEKNGLIIAKDWTGWTNTGEQNTVVSYPNLTKEEIECYVNKGLKDFYYSPKTLIHHLVTIKDFPDFRRKIKGFTNMISGMNK